MQIISLAKEDRCKSLHRQMKTDENLISKPRQMQITSSANNDRGKSIHLQIKTVVR